MSTTVPTTRRSSGTRASVPAPAGVACTQSQSVSARRGRGRPARGPLDACVRCGQPGAKLPKRRYCPSCEAAYRAEAAAWQEKDALHRYLHTRDDLRSVGHLATLRKQTKALGIDWHQEPPAPMTFDARKAVLTLRTAPKPLQPKAKTTTPRAADVVVRPVLRGEAVGTTTTSDLGALDLERELAAIVAQLALLVRQERIAEEKVEDTSDGLQ